MLAMKTGNGHEWGGAGRKSAALEGRVAEAVAGTEGDRDANQAVTLEERRHSDTEKLSENKGASSEGVAESTRLGFLPQPMAPLGSLGAL